MVADARTRLLEAARASIREKGYAATTVDELCRRAGVSKGSFFHHFASKEALAVAVADFWSETTGELFAAAAYHQRQDALSRILAYLDFRRDLVSGEIADFTCLVGTMVQEAYSASEDIRDACWRSIAGHAQTLEGDFAEALADHGVGGVSAKSLALHTQSVIQGGFILAKAKGDAGPAIDAILHLENYIRLLFASGAGRNPTINRKSKGKAA